MQEAYVNIGGVPTHIMTWGKWVEESLEDTKEIVICITGNPGLPGFYSQFMATIYEKLDHKVPVWVIGHLGQDDPPSTSIRKVPPLTGNEKLFNLDGQIKHKLDFIETYVPPNVKIHLIGHSIGAYMILQLLKHQSIKNRVRKCYMLFPTVERMVDSPNGRLFTKVCLPLIPLFSILLRLLSMLPNAIKILFISVYFWLFSIPNHFIGTALKYMKPAVCEKVVFLAKDEMATVCDLDEDLIRANKDLLKFYYGTTDGWVPVKYYKEIKRRIPGIDATLDDKKISHAFVLRSGYEMGCLVSDWVKMYNVSEIF